ncbi:MAG TPA: DNA-directed RNA polymerase subunit alpha [Candidatus Vogelbacteria bacterium]|nr:DNA-directed RNA polymerase subunit alpha [Candidatus Vogelbacteria bacterium]
MIDFKIIMPSQPVVLSEDNYKGVYQIEGLYPGYGHTLGNSLRRIILSSLPGFAVTTLKIEGVDHEFSTLSGVKEDVVSIILNVKKLRFRVIGDEDRSVSINFSGLGKITAKDIQVPAGVEIIDPDSYIAEVTDKNTFFKAEMTLKKGLGYLPKEVIQKEKMDIGAIALDAIFTPVRRASYEVEQMRVGNRTDFNRLIISLETNGDTTPREALEKSITIMIEQLKSIVNFQEPEPEIEEELVEKREEESKPNSLNDKKETEEDIQKTRIEDLDLSSRTQKALANASIRTVGGLARKKEEDILAIAGLGERGLQEIKRVLSNFGIVLK